MEKSFEGSLFLRSATCRSKSASVKTRVSTVAVAGRRLLARFDEHEVAVSSVATMIIPSWYLITMVSSENYERSNRDSKRSHARGLRPGCESRCSERSASGMDKPRG